MIDNRLELSKLAEEALRVTAGDAAAAERAFRELIDSRRESRHRRTGIV